MKLVQQHIINKVLLDIDTNRTQTAYEIKDHLDVFLKDKLFPHLERYFETIEDDLPAAIIQIPKVSIDLTVKKPSDLKEGYLKIKEKLVAQIHDLLTKTPSSSDRILHIDPSENAWRGLHHFLSHGTTPWWEGSKNSFTYTLNDIVKITKSPVFPDQFRSLIQQKVIRQRLIYQCTNQELKILLSTAFYSKNTVKLLSTAFINTIKTLPTPKKNHIWHTIIDYLQSRDERTFISYLHTQFLLIKGENKKLSGNASSIKSAYHFAKAALHIIQYLLQINPIVVKPILLKKHKNQNASEESFATLLLSISDSLKLVSESQFLKNKVVQKEHTTTIKEEKKKENVPLNTSQNEQFLSKVTKQDENTLEIDVMAKHKPDGTHKNDIPTDQKTDNKKLIDDSLTLEENKERTQISKREIEKTNNTDSAISENKKSSHPDSSLTDNLSPNSADTIEETHTLADRGKKTSIPNNSQKHITPEESDRLTPKEKSENNSQKTTSFINLTENQSDHLTSSEISDLLYRDNMHFEDSGAYQIQNAGLIIVHPFIKPFLENCELLDSNNEIIDKEVAVHALHYVATQKEQQLESDMLFEKMLCGVSVQQPINRHIVLSPLIKKQVEELLQAILENWPILKNSSPDLLRSEFLQRPGLLSFKEDNPKITIERKTHDILLDKLPWGIGLCKLPWVEKLIFTDW